MTQRFLSHVSTTLALAPDNFGSLSHLDKAGEGVPLFIKDHLALLMLHACRSQGPADPSRNAPTWNQDAPDPACDQTLPTMSGDHCHTDNIQTDEKHGRDDGILKIEFNPIYWGKLLTTDVLVQRGYRAAPHWLLKCKLSLVHPEIRCSLAFAHLAAEQHIDNTVFDIRTRFNREANAAVISELQARNASNQLTIADLQQECEINRQRIEVAIMAREALPARSDGS